VIGITDTAIKEVRRIIEEQNLPESTALRVGVKGGGCSGLSYVLEFSESKEKDHVLEQEDFRVFCDPKSFLYLNGMSLDFEDGLMSRGFKFQNPYANRTCGCGDSFST